MHNIYYPGLSGERSLPFGLLVVVPCFPLKTGHQNDWIPRLVCFFIVYIYHIDNFATVRLIHGLVKSCAKLKKILETFSTSPTFKQNVGKQERNIFKVGHIVVIIS